GQRRRQQRRPARRASGEPYPERHDRQPELLRRRRGGQPAPRPLRRDGSERRPGGKEGGDALVYAGRGLEYEERDDARRAAGGKLLARLSAEQRGPRVPQGLGRQRGPGVTLLFISLWEPSRGLLDDREHDHLALVVLRHADDSVNDFNGHSFTRRAMRSP